MIPLLGGWHGWCDPCDNPLDHCTCTTNTQETDQ